MTRNRGLRSTAAALLLGLLAIPANAAFVITMDDAATTGIDVIVMDNASAGAFSDSGLETTHADLDTANEGRIVLSDSAGAFRWRLPPGLASRKQETLTQKR